MKRMQNRKRLDQARATIFMMKVPVAGGGYNKRKILNTKVIFVTY
jgi:hypothetical protein